MQDNAQITKLLGQLHDAVAEQVTELNRLLESEEQTIAGQVEQRKQLAQQLQLPERILTIYREVKYYPHWARNRPEDVCPLVTDIDVVEERKKGLSDTKTTVRFSLKSRRYSFLLDDGYMHEVGYNVGSLTLSGPNGEALFQLRTSGSEFSWVKYAPYNSDSIKHGNTSTSRSEFNVKYELGRILGFVPGDWVLDFIELSEAIAMIAAERERRYKLSQIERQKQDFGLNVSESEVQMLQSTLGIPTIEEEHRSAGTIAVAIRKWLRRLFGQRHDDGSKAP